MNIEVWITFVVATFALLAIPGPVVMMLLGYTISGGKSVAATAIPGVVLGDLFAMTISFLGAGAILQASATLFLGLKIFGAGYLIWLGYKLWTSHGNALAEVTRDHAPIKISVMRDAFFVTALNPKDIVFFIAFLPHFIDPVLPTLPQLAILQITFAVLVLTTTTVWVLLADKIVSRLKSAKTTRLVTRFGAGWLILAGVATAART